MSFSKGYHKFYQTFYNGYYSPLYRESRKTYQNMLELNKGLVLKIGGDTEELEEFNTAQNPLTPFINENTEHHLIHRSYMGINLTSRSYIGEVLANKFTSLNLRDSLLNSTFGKYLIEEFPFFHPDRTAVGVYSEFYFADLLSILGLLEASILGLTPYSKLKFPLHAINSAMRYKIEEFLIKKYDVSTEEVEIAQQITQFASDYVKCKDWDKVNLPKEVKGRKLNIFADKLTYKPKTPLTHVLNTLQGQFNLNSCNTKSLTFLPLGSNILTRDTVNTVVAKKGLGTVNLYTLTYSASDLWLQLSPQGDYGISLTKCANLSADERFALFNSNNTNIVSVLGNIDTYVDLYNRGHKGVIAKLLFSGLIAPLPKDRSNVIYDKDLINTYESLLIEDSIGVPRTNFKKYYKSNTLLKSVKTTNKKLLEHYIPELVFKFHNTGGVGKSFQPFPGITNGEKAQGLGNTVKTLTRYLYEIKKDIEQYVTEPLVDTKYRFNRPSPTSSIDIDNVAKKGLFARNRELFGCYTVRCAPITLSGPNSKLRMSCYVNNIYHSNSNPYFEKFIQWGLAKHREMPKELQIPQVKSQTEHITLVWASFFTLYSKYLEEYTTFNKAFTSNGYKKLKHNS